MQFTGISFLGFRGAIGRTHRQTSVLFRWLMIGWWVLARHDSSQRHGTKKAVWSNYEIEFPNRNVLAGTANRGAGASADLGIG
jgi:hypothetical protein